MFASHHELNNLIAFVDRNQLCVTDFTEDIVRLEPLGKRWKSFGWEVIIINGHSFKEIFLALEGVRSRRSRKPLMIIADTIKGKGISFMENQPLWHGIAPQGKDAKRAKNELMRKRGHKK